MHLVEEAALSALDGLRGRRTDMTSDGGKALSSLTGVLRYTCSATASSVDVLPTLTAQQEWRLSEACHTLTVHSPRVCMMLHCMCEDGTSSEAEGTMYGKGTSIHAHIVPKLLHELGP